MEEILIAGCALLILYLSFKLWIAEHDRNLLLEHAQIVPAGYGAEMMVLVGLLAFLLMIAALGIAFLWLAGVI
ncbi:MAG: hypothetical protein ACPL7R_01850 [Anaerolineae bacterium]